MRSANEGGLVLPPPSTSLQNLVTDYNLKISARTLYTMSKPSRAYCFTAFSRPVCDEHPAIRYMIYGKEKCPKTGKKHYQGYLELHKPARLSALKKIFEDETVHFESRKGTRDQAREYCMKEGRYVEFGDWAAGGSGARNDLKKICRKLQQGVPLKEIAMKEPQIYCRYRNGLRDIAAWVQEKSVPEYRKLDVCLICGPTGCGKTRYAMKHAQYKIEGRNLKWWQDYDGEDVICIDEYNNDVPITEMLNLLDVYKLRLNVKGGHTYANWTKVYITTNLRPSELHPVAKEEHRNALFRRINRIVNYYEESPEKVLDPEIKEEPSKPKKVVSEDDSEYDLLYPDCDSDANQSSDEDE